MRTCQVLLIAILFLSFSQINAQNSKIETIKNLLKEIPIFDGAKIDANQPIESINTIAKQKAAKTIIFTKENIKDALSEAKNYKYCIIIVGNHTIVKVTDIKDNAMSGSWGTNMPKGEGYIQKGSLVSTNGYINNIIGNPDDQVRTLYFFN